MSRLLAVSLMLALVVSLIGCGNVFVSGTLNPGFSTVSGTVSFIQLTSVVDGSGGFVQVTFVTFVSGSSTTIGFCGDQRNQFTMNQNMQAQFNPGQTCSTIIVVIII